MLVPIGRVCWDRQVSTISGEPLRVLYVEDDPALRGILSAILTSRKDLEVVATAASPTEALAEAERVEFDVALLDLALGDDDMSGIELGMALRERRPEIGVVILSQHQVPAFLTALRCRSGMGARALEFAIPTAAAPRCRTWRWPRTCAA